MSFTFKVRPEDRMAHYRAVQAKEIRAYRSQILVAGTFYVLPLLLGIYAALPEQLFIGIVIIVSLGYYVYRNADAYRAVENIPDPSGLAEVTVNLTILNEGLQEKVEGLVNFAPWSSLRSFRVFQDRLIIELAGGHWAIVPKDTLPSPTDFEDIKSELVKRAIAEKTA